MKHESAKLRTIMFEKYKILEGMLRLWDFTIPELSQISGAQPATVRTEPTLEITVLILGVACGSTAADATATNAAISAYSIIS